MGTSHRTQETPLYKFDQLTPEVQEKVLDKRRYLDRGHEWWDSVYEDAVQMAAYLGIEIGKRRDSNQPAIFFSGFSSQGDGACFEGTYRYKPGSLRELRSAAPSSYKDLETGKWTELKSNAELHAICKGLQDVQRRHSYKLEAKVKQRGHYQHSGCTHIEVSHADAMYRDIGDAEDDIKQLLRDFMDWIYSRLEDEDTYRSSNEYLREEIEANEYEFDEHGEQV